MNRNRLIFVGIFALALAGLVSLAIYRVLRVTLNAATGASSTVVVAANNIPVGVRLQEKDLRLVKMPAADLPQGVFHSTLEALGRGVILPITANEMILDNKVVAANGGAGLPALIPAGMRAVSVRVNEVVSVAGFVTPGTRVDVLLTGNPTRDNAPEEVTTSTVLENVQVLAAGQQLQRNSEGQPQSVPVITLLVNPEDAERLTLASSEGRIQLSLRNPLDMEKSKVAALKNGTLYGVVSRKEQQPAPKKQAKDKKAPVVPPPTSIYVVEMIRGDKRESAKF